MDDLAECAGVSRRTLFNYVPGKVDAVLGAGAEPDPALIATFVAGGPSGHLLTDVKELVCVLLQAEGADPAEVIEIRRLLLADPRLHAAVHERFVARMEQFSAGVAAREGNAVDPLTVRLVANLTISLFDTALDEALSDSSRTLPEHYSRVFDAAVRLVATSSADHSAEPAVVDL